jgi:hypothetical protein
LVDRWAHEISVRHGIQERYHCYFRLAAQHAYRSATGVGRPTQENDSEDLQLTMHLADDAIVLTRDFALIEQVDETESFQAPWVRSLGEVLDGRVPEGKPWGRSARRATHGHQIRRARDLAKLEEEVLGRLSPR